MESKKCTKCCVVRLLSEFYNKKANGNEKRNICKVCESNRAKEYVKNNSDKVKAKKKSWRQDNHEKILANNREYRLTNKVNVNNWKRESVIRSRARDIKGCRLKVNIKASRAVENLYPGYLNYALKRAGIPITKETIELKRNIILIKRFKKTITWKIKNS